MTCTDELYLQYQTKHWTAKNISEITYFCGVGHQNSIIKIDMNQLQNAQIHK